jgi:putative hydrolase of the HAD superfamily
MAFDAGRGEPVSHQRGVWIFDLDHTLYDPGVGVLAEVDRRMGDIIARELRLDRDEAVALQHRYWRDYGATAAGLLLHHDIDPQRFLDEAHAVTGTGLTADGELRALLSALPGERLIFTNGPRSHAERVLADLHIADQFDRIFDIAAVDFRPKPAPESFTRVFSATGRRPDALALIDDRVENIESASALGARGILIHPEPGDHEGAHAPDIKTWLREELDLIFDPKRKQAA